MINKPKNPPKMKYTPEHKIVVHRFPSGISPSKVISITLNGVQKGLLDTSSSIIKPFKKPKQKREPRFMMVEMEFDQMIVAREVRMNLSTGDILVVGCLHSVVLLYPQVLTPSKTTITTFYERKKGRKPINTYFQGPGHAFFGIDRVFERYDRVYCVDTNTATGCNGSTVAVTTAITVTSKKVGDTGIYISSDHTIELVAIDPPAGNPELHGIWMLLARTWEKHPHLLQGRLAIITDTELEKIKAWNERIEPFYDGHMLPEGVDIFYASADVGSEEYLPNRLMKACDSLSTKKLQEMC